MADLERRLRRLEIAWQTTDNHLRGTLDVLPGQRPEDALAGAAPGLWLLTDAACNEGWLGQVNRDGTVTVYASNGGALPCQ